MTQPLRTSDAMQHALQAQHTTQTSHTPHTLELAAVAYLNMLPFFAEDPHIHLLGSPRELNSQQPTCQAYCSSLIAGLASHKRPLSNQIGVFSAGAVQSVFIEPVLHSKKHSHFWRQLEEFWAHRHPDPVAGLHTPETHGNIILRSNGSSEQSIWMVKVLSTLAGFTLDVQEDLATSASAATTTGNSNPEAKPLPEARLWIGDPALQRRLAAPDTYRIDVGHIWNTHMGHKAWFAGWFAGARTDSELNSTDMIFSTLKNRIHNWQSRSEFSRWCAIHDFLEKQNSPLLRLESAGSASTFGMLTTDDHSRELREVMHEYFAGLTFVVDAKEGEMLLNFYLALQAALASTDNRNAHHPNGSIKSLQRSSVATLAP